MKSECVFSQQLRKKWPKFSTLITIMVKCGEIYIVPLAKYDSLLYHMNVYLHLVIYSFKQNESDFLLRFLSGKKQTSKKCHACAVKIHLFIRILNLCHKVDKTVKTSF